MSTFCSKCGKEIPTKIYPDNTCQGCYKYFRSGGTISPLPAKGTIVYDHRGFVVCHICGRAYKRLGSHIKESHGMTISQYKEEFGLCNSARTTEHTYSTHMKVLAYRHEMPQRLQEAGKGTRVKIGEKHLRYGKKCRLQECLDKRNRKFIKGEMPYESNRNCQTN